MADFHVGNFPVSNGDGAPGGIDLAAVAARIAAERQRTVEQIDDLARMLGEIIDASTAVATDDEHDPEGPTIAFERAQATAILHQARERLLDLDRATERLSSGTYGLCEQCGRPIGEDRLDARPSSRTCIVCASRRR